MAVSSSRSSTSPDVLAGEMERAAAERITAATKRAEEAERESGIQIDQVRDEYDKRREGEAIRAEDALYKQQQKHYEVLREMQRAHNAELARAKRDGERDLDKTQNFYRDQVYKTEQDAQAKIRELQGRSAIQEDFEKNKIDQQKSTTISENQAQIQGLRSKHEETLTGMEKAYRDDLEQKKNLQHVATETAQTKIREQSDRILSQHQADYQRLNAEANRQLQALRASNTSKLGAYSSRNSDPFYKIMGFNAAITEREGAYEIRANVPTHEQQNVAAAVRGDTLVLTGRRRNQESLEVAPGQTRTTESLQTFSESYPLPGPVEPRSLSKTFEGSTMTVRISKKSPDFSYKPYQSETPERIKATRPNFPSELPENKKT